MALARELQNKVAPEPQPAKRKRSKWRAVWRNKPLVIGGIIVLLVLVAAVFAPFLSHYGPNSVDTSSVLQPPGGKHWLGTDELGRDEYARILMGARTSMVVSVGSLIVGLVIGVPVGLISGFYRGFMDDWIIMRIVDAMQAFPFLILALVLAAMLGPGERNAMIAIGVGYVPIFVRIVRGQVLGELEREFVSAARMIGASDWRIMWKHIFPNTLTPLIVQATLAMASGIVAEASLSYLGLGAQPPTASWGTMLNTAQGYMGEATWLAIFPGVAIAIAVLGFNLLGDGLQRWLDPRRRH
ncbi:ABC transporter permease [Alicyclobacillus mengziensis]|uniref:ABC transporter permease n=1 Tax=Alicyclobacillus mengziensis TaxID=2931921 RepID=A0A9X7W0C3_9BACL|nr:ABC transporter permease [Alicyclobacillus mengziensis]QSO47847.1 ABC transporter permease [Alicyclobacillus mengziensis]